MQERQQWPNEKMVTTDLTSDQWAEMKTILSHYGFDDQVIDEGIILSEKLANVIPAPDQPVQVVMVACASILSQFAMILSDGCDNPECQSCAEISGDAEYKALSAAVLENVMASFSLARSEPAGRA